MLREAERLGLMVPGMDGYVPMRERPALRKLDGWRTPDWWEVLEDAKAPRTLSSPLSSPVPPLSPAVKEKGSAQHVEDAFYDANTSYNLYDARKTVEPEQVHVNASQQSRTEAGPLQQQQQQTPTQPQPPSLNVHAPSDTDYGARGQLELGSIEELVSSAER